VRGLCTGRSCPRPESTFADFLCFAVDSRSPAARSRLGLRPAFLLPWCLGPHSCRPRSLVYRRSGPGSRARPSPLPVVGLAPARSRFAFCCAFCCSVPVTDSRTGDSTLVFSISREPHRPGSPEASRSSVSRLW
jgi:hypothetical protein